MSASSRARAEALVADVVKRLPPDPEPRYRIRPYRKRPQVPLPQHTGTNDSSPDDISDSEYAPDLSISDDDITLRKSVAEAMRDWSGTGRGPHIEFQTHESVPLVPGRMLGRGAMGDVYEITIQGYQFAWKKITSKRKVTLNQRKEIEILKKLNHAHMVQLVGTYTYRLDLGILLFPVAVCDLHTFFEDIEAHWTTGTDDGQKSRLVALRYVPIPGSSSKASPAYHQIGCLVSAIEYLHRQEIRHKDLKPSNILLSPNQLWLSDFGSATDFSILSQSATDNERGTPRYFAPEVADWQKNGRAADMFSLGCVLLEIIVLHADGTLRRIRDNRPNPNPAFHANLKSLDSWLPFSDGCSPGEHHLIKEVRAMLSVDPKQRPLAQDLLQRLNLANEMMGPGRGSMFGDCCRKMTVSTEHHKKQLRLLEFETEEWKEKSTGLEFTLLDKEQQWREDEARLSFRVVEQDAIIHKLHAENRNLEVKYADIFTERGGLRVRMKKRIEELEQELERARLASKAEEVHRSSGVATPIPAGNDSDTSPIPSKENRYGKWLSPGDLPSTSLWPPSENPLPEATDRDNGNLSAPQGHYLPWSPVHNEREWSYRPIKSLNTDSMDDLASKFGSDSPASTLSNQRVPRPVSATPGDPPYPFTRPSTPQQQKAYLKEPFGFSPESDKSTVLEYWDAAMRTIR